MFRVVSAFERGQVPSREDLVAAAHRIEFADRDALHLNGGLRKRLATASKSAIDALRGSALGTEERRKTAESVVASLVERLAGGFTVARAMAASAETREDVGPLRSASSLLEKPRKNGK